MRHLIFFLLFLSFAIPAQAQTLEFVYSKFPPFEYHEGDTDIGMNIDILKEACRRLNITPVFRELPWKRALGYAEHGKTDAIFSLLKIKHA